LPFDDISAKKLTKPIVILKKVVMPNQSSVHHLENLLFFTLLQLIVIIVAARLANVAARKLGQPGAVGEMMAGLILGPSLLGAMFPDAFSWLFKSVSAEPITIMSQIGLTLLMINSVKPI
jgi:Sodium/hydrogen exchanger family